MSDEAKQALAQRDDVKAEYEAEFESDAGAEGQPKAIVRVEELQELLGPSHREKTTAVILAFRKRIKNAEREVEEMEQREVALKTQNKQAIEHNAKLAAERDFWRDMKDPQRVFRAQDEENAKLRVKVAELEERLADAKVRQATAETIAVNAVEKIRLWSGPVPSPRPWWRFWGRA